MRSSHRPTAVAVLCWLGALAALPATANPLPFAPPGGGTHPGAACATLADDRERLQCFDRSFGRMATPVDRPGPVEPPPASRSLPVEPPLRLGGPIERAWSTEPGEPLFRLRPYQALYVLPVSHTDNINRRPSSPSPNSQVGIDLPNRDLEAKFQLSAKALAWQGLMGERGDVWIGYTQSSRWQLYQGDISRPFRETNYEPEVILNFGIDGQWLGWRARSLGVAFNHQSNGRAQPLSRSWNRVIGHLGVERGPWALTLRPWWRLSESAEQDDNPDISDHIGRGDLHIQYDAGGGHAGGLRLRHTLRSGERSRGSAEFDWRFPLTGSLQGYVQVFTGYGESLIDYNIRQTRLGLGFALAHWR